jgi:UDP-3-O-[3-hydroxymyristoyl] glucosamine N-acyltransferase
VGLPETAAQLARQLGGRLEGPDRAITGLASLERAGETEVAFAERGLVRGSAAGVLLIREALPDRTCVVVPDPKLAFITLLRERSPAPEAGVHPRATVHPTARLGADVRVEAGCVVMERCEIGERTVLFPNVVLYPDTVLGPDCRIHAGAVLGADGFAYHPTADGPVKVPQVGRVRLGARVEVGANTTIDRASLDETVIGDDCKLDNLVQIGHNSRLGRAVIIAAQAGLSGSVELGDGVILAGQVGVADHATVGERAVVGGQSGVSGALPGRATYLGTPALPARLTRRIWAALQHLPAMWRGWGD